MKIILQHTRILIKNYIFFLYHLSISRGSDNLNLVEYVTDVLYFITEYYKIINEEINNLQCDDCNHYFLLFHPKGFLNNRITDSLVSELYIDRCYRSFSNYKSFFNTKKLYGEYDMIFLEGKKHNLRTENEYEVVMGLLEYYSELYSKHIIVSVKRNTFCIQIIKAYYAPIEPILEYF